jgi:hypothetical protein
LDATGSKKFSPHRDYQNAAGPAIVSSHCRWRQTPARPSIRAASANGSANGSAHLQNAEALGSFAQSS